MGLVLLCLAVALVAALATGGRLSALESIPIRGWPLLAAAAGAQVLAWAFALLGLPVGLAYAAGLAVSGVSIAVFLVVNGALVGTGLIAAGLLANAVVIAANGAMPVSARAAVRSGAGAGTVADQLHEPATDATRLRLLGDVIAVPLPLRPEVDSPGDVLAAAGLAEMLFTALRRSRRDRYVGARAARRGSRTGPPVAAPPPVAGLVGTAQYLPAYPTTEVAGTDDDGEVTDGQAGTQAARAGEEEGEPRQEAERLARGPESYG